MSRQSNRHIILALLCGTAALYAATAVAGSAAEQEANDPIVSAQRLAIQKAAGAATGGADVDAVLGLLSGAPVGDVDFFTFQGQAGDVVTLDIDGGMGGGRSVDTMLGVFGPGPAYPLLRFNDDGGMPLDPGSISSLDSRIQNFRLPATGVYTVGVSSFPRALRPGGTLSSNMLNARSNGDYALLISGVSVAVLQISIDIKPGSDEVAPINPKARGKVPVALLGAADFAVTDIEVDALTFGHSGDEASLHKCGAPEDINGDGLLDRVCHFDNQAAAIQWTDDEALLKGRLKDGRLFEGQGWLKVVPHKAAAE